MIDSYFSAASADDLASLRADYPNIIGPAPGRAPTPESVDQNGLTIAATPAAGNPALWYIAVRSDAAVNLPAGADLCDAATAQAVLGIWA